jgi:hypothetical protein
MNVMAYPVTLSESLAIIDQETPQVTSDPDIQGEAMMFGADGTINTPVNQAFVIIQTGTITDGTLDVKLVQGTSNAFSTVKDITDKTVSLASNTQGIINLKSEELDAAGGYDYWRYDIQQSTGASACTFSLVVVGGDSRYGPTSDYDLSTVTVVK